MSTHTSTEMSSQMSNQITQLPSETLHMSELTIQLSDPVTELLKAAKRPNTLRAYRSDWQAFTNWCADNSLQSLPASPQCVSAYIAAKQGQLSVATVQRHIASISTAHKTAGHNSPTAHELVRTTMQGLRALGNQVGKRAGRKGKAPALTAEHMRKVIDAIPYDYAGVRDIAVLLIGYKAALRRSEIASICWENIDMQVEGMVLNLQGTKTDSEYAGQRVAVAYESGKYCAVQAIMRYATLCNSQGIGTEQGAVFRNINKHMQLGESLTAASVGAIVTARCAEIGLDGMTAHSLRRGHLTEGHKQGRNEADLMRTSRHKSVQVFRGYIDDADLFGRATGKGLL